MHDFPAFRLEAAKRVPCDRIVRKDKAVPERIWRALDGLPWQKSNMAKRPERSDPDAYTEDGESLAKDGDDDTERDDAP